VREVAKTTIIFCMTVLFVFYVVDKKIEILNLKNNIENLEDDLAIDRTHIEETNNIITDMKNHIDFLESQLSETNEKIREYEDNIHEVTVTMYHPVPEQTDDTPDITADGTKFKIHKASQYRYVAVARNMLKRWGGFLDYGDYIWVEAGSKSGVYQVRDTMNPRYVNHIDILETPGTSPYKYDNAKMRLVSYEQ
jgi:3D (Asp-Asp-Asp) domain-containing protein